MTSIAMHLPKRLPAASIPNADMVQAGQYRLLICLQSGADWRNEATQMLGGSGSYCNRAAIRVASVGLKSIALNHATI